MYIKRLDGVRVSRIRLRRVVVQNVWRKQHSAPGAGKYRHHSLHEIDPLGVGYLPSLWLFISRQYMYQYSGNNRSRNRASHPSPSSSSGLIRQRRLLVFIVELVVFFARALGSIHIRPEIRSMETC